MKAWLACKGRRSTRLHRHRTVLVYAYDGPFPLPAGWSPRTAGSTLDLNCPRCGFAPRASDDGLRELIEMAAGKPGRILYIDGP